jgi:hypothetical protein
LATNIQDWNHSIKPFFNVAFERYSKQKENGMYKLGALSFFTSGLLKKRSLKKKHVQMQNKSTITKKPLRHTIKHKTNSTSVHALNKGGGCHESKQ